MRVINKIGDDLSVVGGKPSGMNWLRNRINPRLNKFRKNGLITNNPNLHSIAWPSTGLAKEINEYQVNLKPDLIHLHWIGDSTISIEEIGNLPQPIIWTLHDQWPFCGAEHYTWSFENSNLINADNIINQRFSEGYKKTNRPNSEEGRDINLETWHRKKKSWKKAFYMVATTKWLAECASESALMHDWPLRIIPYPINTKEWSPINKNLARSILCLPKDKPLILFGAIGGISDLRKGADLLLEALKKLDDFDNSEINNLELVVFGQTKPADFPNLNFPIHWMGKLTDDVALRLAYSAVDLFVAPSRQEAFGQTASESQSCGTPVVAFNTGGLKDVVENYQTGCLAEPFSSDSLANSINWVFKEPQRRIRLGKAARERAVALWTPSIIAGLYNDLYQNALLDNR